MVNLKQVNELYEKCTLCPNNCQVNRTAGIKGRCGQTDKVKVAWCGLHRGEEPPVTGKKGSGMIFFCGCSLHCQYCQNYQISSLDGAGIEISVRQLTDIMLKLQEMGAETLNLVTGTHFVPAIINAVSDAKNKGFTLPIVWNSSGYESVETLKLIDPFIDLYLFDLKTLNPCTASKFCGLEKYAEVIVPAVKFLKKRHPNTDLDNLKGTLIRHLVFPGEFQSTLDFIDFYADNLKDCCALSMMVQFVPPKENPGFKPVSKEQYKKILDKLDQYNIDGYIQELDDNEYLWIPDFNKDCPFPAGFADPLPYFLELKHKAL